MKYFIMQQDPRILEQPSILDSPQDIDPIEWYEGKVVNDPKVPILLKLSPRSSDFRGDIIDGILTLFHDCLRDGLVKLGVDNVQYFPVELENQFGEIEIGYSLVNIIGLLDAVDRTASTIKFDDAGSIETLYSFKIDPEKTRNFRIFRVVGAPNLIIVDEALKDELISSIDPSGVWMYPTEDYDGWS